jgi:hypothetical protein
MDVMRGDNENSMNFQLALMMKYLQRVIFIKSEREYRVTIHVQANKPSKFEFIDRKRT